MGQEIQPKSLPKIAEELPCPATAHPLPAGKIAGGWSIPAIAAQSGAQGESLGAENLNYRVQSVILHLLSGHSFFLKKITEPDNESFRHL